MHKRLISFLAIGGLLATFTAGPVAADNGNATVDIMVMKHLCDASIQSEADFKAVEAKANGNPVGALVQTVLACPTTVNPGDATSDGIKSDATAFTFSIESAGQTTDMPSDTAAAKLCESDVKLDANGDGKISKDVCLDISHYMFKGVANGDATVAETDPPAGFRFGTLRFTPTEIDGNNDKSALVSFGGGTIRLDTTQDNDAKIMLHVYNFANAMPNSDTAAAVGTSTPAPAVPLALLAGLLVVSGLGAAYALKRNAA